MENQKQGEWIYDSNGIPHCSECGFMLEDRGISPYCPECGACMEPDPDWEEGTRKDAPQSEKMNRKETMAYIQEHFSCSGEALRLIDNILSFVETQGVDGEEQFFLLRALLDGAIGLTSDEIRKIFL